MHLISNKKQISKKYNATFVPLTLLGGCVLFHNFIFMIDLGYLFKDRHINKIKQSCRI